MTQIDRAGPALARVIEREDWHPRLLNGSDYPLPGVMPIFSVDYLVSLGLVQESAAPVLKEIRAHNPLLFDFVLKRHLRSNGKALAKAYSRRGRSSTPPSSSRARRGAGATAGPDRGRSRGSNQVRTQYQ